MQKMQQKPKKIKSPCAVSGIQNNFNPTRNSESARRNAPDSVHGGEIRDIKCKTGQPTVQLPPQSHPAGGGLPIKCHHDILIASGADY